MDSEILEKNMAAIGSFYPKHIEHLICAFLRRVKMETKGCLVHRLLQPHQPVQLGLTSPGLLGLDACLVAADVFLSLLDMFLLFS